MSTTPRTDAARGFHDMDTAVSAEDMAQLETELVAAKLEADGEARWALEYLARAEKAEAELAEMSSIAEKWEDDARRYARNAEYWQSRAYDAEADTARLDWLDENINYSGGGSGGTYTFFTPADVECGMLRDAIDAATKEASK